MPTPEVHKVTVQIKPPGKFHPTGLITYGYYTYEDGVLTMTDPKGVPAEDGMGRRYVERDVPANTVTGVACFLTKKLRAELRGSGAGPKQDIFARKIEYPKTGWR